MLLHHPPNVVIDIRGLKRLDLVETIVADTLSAAPSRAVAIPVRCGRALFILT